MATERLYCVEVVNRHTGAVAERMAWADDEHAAREKAAASGFVVGRARPTGDERESDADAGGAHSVTGGEHPAQAGGLTERQIRDAVARGVARVAVLLVIAGTGVSVALVGLAQSGGDAGAWLSIGAIGGVAALAALAGLVGLAFGDGAAR